MSRLTLAPLRETPLSPRLLALAVAVLLGYTSSGRAQVPTVPAVPAPPTAPGVPLAAPPGAPAAPAAPSNLWSFLCPSPEQKAQCKEKLCKMPITQLFDSMLKPVTLFSGGLVTSCCPTGPSAQDLAAPADSMEGAAARIQQSEMEAKKRRATVRYLGTVDCRYWPEAEAALIAGLRADPNECVRYEAALALGNGCCCTKPIIDALVITVSGSMKDNHPAEASQRVREQARAALDRCLTRYTQIVGAPESEKRPERPERPTPPATEPSGQTLHASYVVPAIVPPPAPVAPVTLNAAPVTAPPPGQRTLYDIILCTTPTTTPAPQPAPAPSVRPGSTPTGKRDLFTILENTRSSGK